MAPQPTLPRPMMDATILRIVRTLSQKYERVYPRMVQAHLYVYRAEQTLRKDMGRLAEKGLLERIGQRKGYKPVKLSKVYQCIEPVQLSLPVKGVA